MHFLVFLLAMLEILMSTKAISQTSGSSSPFSYNNVSCSTSTTTTALGATISTGVSSAVAIPIFISGTSSTSTINLNDGRIPFSNNNLCDTLELEKQRSIGYQNRRKRSVISFAQRFFTSSKKLQARRDKRTQKELAKRNAKITELDLAPETPNVDIYRSSISIVHVPEATEKEVTYYPDASQIPKQQVDGQGE